MRSLGFSFICIWCDINGSVGRCPPSKIDETCPSFWICDPHSVNSPFVSSSAILSIYSSFWIARSSVTSMRSRSCLKESMSFVESSEEPLLLHMWFLPAFGDVRRRDLDLSDWFVLFGD